MKTSYIILVLMFLSYSLCAQDISKKVCKYKYEDFQELSINDTSDAVIDLFYSKKESALYNQMSLLPLSIILAVAPTPAQVVGLGSFILSGPLFLSGSYKLVRYRKKKLKKVLEEYKEHQTLPSSVRKKTNHLLNNYYLQQMDY